MSFGDCDSAHLPPPFAAFAVPPPSTASHFSVSRERVQRPDAPLLASNDVWQLFDLGDRLCCTAGVTGAAAPLLRADLARDWMSGEISVDPEAPLTTQRAPITSPLGELIVLSQLNTQGGLYVHAASVAWGDEAYLLLGASGAGKSTLSHLAEQEGATVLSDDRTVLREEGGVLYAYGTPFHGTGERWAARKLPVRAITFLSHGPETVLSTLTPGKGIARLLSLCFTPFWSKAAVERAADTVTRFMPLAPCRALSFVPSREAAVTLRQTLPR